MKYKGHCSSMIKIYCHFKMVLGFFWIFFFTFLISWELSLRIFIVDKKLTDRLKVPSEVKTGLKLCVRISLKVWKIGSSIWELRPWSENLKEKKNDYAGKKRKKKKKIKPMS